jgi:DNA-binding transcriptional regulator/RsmH inhibitor MraZ
MATFIGDYACKVDAKGRIILPMAFKKQMPAGTQDHFVVRKDIFEHCSIFDRRLEQATRKDQKQDKPLQPGA